MSSSRNPPLKILLFPFPSPGHYLPLIDIAALLASRGASATVVLNPSILSRLPLLLLLTPNLLFHSLPFPSAAAGISSGLPTALSLLRLPFSDLLRRLSPSALISDSLLPFAAESSAELNIPCFSFPGTGLFSLTVDRTILLLNPPHQTNPFLVPGLPHRVELTQTQLKETTLPGDMTREFFALAEQAERFTTGVIVNSFTDLEPGYAELYRKETGKNIYLVGPVSTIRRLEEEAEEEEDGRIMKWLNKKEEKSVIYVCFGSLCRLPKDQILEIGRGLEDSGVAFIWVIREASTSPEVAEIEERVSERGILVRGWIAGQSALLRHPSIGGFLTHCGWGAVTEAAAAGVPMLTWPLFGEQFYNERLVNDVVGIGVGIGVKEGFVWGEEEKIGVLVGREIIREKVRFLMADSTGSGSDEGMDGVRKRVNEMGEKARKAMAEGGSSYMEVERLLEDCRLLL